MPFSWGSTVPLSKPCSQAASLSDFCHLKIATSTDYLSGFFMILLGYVVGLLRFSRRFELELMFSLN